MKKLIIVLGLALLMPTGSFADNTGESPLVSARGDRDNRKYIRVYKAPAYKIPVYENPVYENPTYEAPGYEEDDYGY
jgi:hypothetical protein